MTLNKKNTKRVDRIRTLVAEGRVREACDLYHEDAVDHTHWRSEVLKRLRAARQSNPRAKMHPSTRRNINDDSRALRTIRNLVDPEDTFAHAADFLPIP